MEHGDIGNSTSTLLLARFERLVGLPPNKRWRFRRGDFETVLLDWRVSRLGAASLVRLRNQFDARIELYTFMHGTEWAEAVYRWVTPFCPFVSEVHWFGAGEVGPARLDEYARANSAKRVFDPDPVVVQRLGILRASLAAEDSELTLLF